MESVRTMNSFKLVERKLDRIQEFVNGHGNTLKDIKKILVNLTVGDPDCKQLTFPIRRSIAIQYDGSTAQIDTAKFKRKFSHLPSQIKESHMRKESKFDNNLRGRRSGKQNMKKKSAFVSRQRVESHSVRRVVTGRGAKVAEKKQKK